MTKKEEMAAAEILAKMRAAREVTVLTGSGISASLGIPTIPELAVSDWTGMADPSRLTADPEGFWAAYREIFLRPIFEKGPSLAHRVLARLEQEGVVRAIVTTNVDCLHERAGSPVVHAIWGSLDVNACAMCGRIYPLEALRDELPRCSRDGGLLIPDPVRRQLATVPEAVAAANAAMVRSDLTLVVGCNGYYSRTGARVINVNLRANIFDDGAELVVRASAEAIFGEMAGMLGVTG